MGLGDLSPEGSIVLGVFVGILSTSIQSLGLTLQRKSHMLEEEKELQDSRRPPYRRRRWQLGMLMFVVSNLVGSTIQITTLPLPVLSTLQAAGLVFNSLCATLILGEPFTRYAFLGTVLVCGGALLIAIFGAISEPAHDLVQLLALLGRKQFIGWMIGQAALVVAVLLGARLSKTFSPFNKNSPRMRLFRGMAYGAVSGILSAHSLLVAKSAVELIVKSIVDHNNQFNQWQSWMILFWLIALALSQLYYLHRGLKLCSTSVLYPFVFCVYNIIAILDGLIYFNQTSLISVLDGCLIALGTVILLSGVVCLSWRLQEDKTTPAQAPVAQSTLAPGFGFATSDTDSADTDTPSSSTDEEAQLLPKHSQTLPAIPTTHQQDLPSYGAIDSTSTTPLKRSVHYAPDLVTASTPNTPSPRLSRQRLRHAADEIWDELEEDSPPMPFTRRHSLGVQSRAGLAPSKLRSSSGGSHGISEQALESSSELPPLEEGLARSGTGRIYRDRRKKRSSGGTGERQEEPKQNAQGGWWRMRRWWKIGSGEQKGKGKGKDISRSDDPDEGDRLI